MLKRSIITVAAVFCLHAPAWAATYLTPHIPDRFEGDTSIYKGDVSAIKPNILYMVDNSAGMAQPGSGATYDPARTYPNVGYNTNEVYVRIAATGGTINYNSYIASVTPTVTCAAAKTTLLNTGAFTGKLKKDGTCTAPQEGNYYLGNLLNYMYAPADLWAASTDYLGGDVVKAVSGDKYTWTCTVAGKSGATAPAWPTLPDPLPGDFWTNPAYDSYRAVTENKSGGNVCGDTLAGEPPCVKWELSSPLISLVNKTMGTVLAREDVRTRTNAGLIVFGGNNSGGEIRAPVGTIEQGTVAGAANFNKLITEFDKLAAPNGLLNANQQSVNELLYDASWYFRGLNNSTSKISSDKASYPNPIAAYCQENFVVMITTGASHNSGQNVKALIDDKDKNGTLGNTEDSAKLLFDTDHLVDAVIDPDAQKQNVKTVVIQLITELNPFLIMTAAYGAGKDNIIITIPATPEKAADFQTAQTTSTCALNDAGSYVCEIPVKWLSGVEPPLVNPNAANTPKELELIVHNLDQLPTQGVYYYHVTSGNELAEVLSALVEGLVLDSTTSFVAPTIPVSQQENLRSYSGNRVYMGFFRPIKKTSAWRGNIKKYAINPNTGDILDASTPSKYATYVDMQDPWFKDDRDDTGMDTKDVNGDFRPNSKSFWTSNDCWAVNEADGRAYKSRYFTPQGDGGIVDCGGVGEKLVYRTAPRNIYTFLPQTMIATAAKESSNLTAPVNRFDLTNPDITPRLLNYLSAAEAGADAYLQRFVVANPEGNRWNLIRYMHGVDVYGTNPPGYDSPVPGRRMWVMGDVLHAKPVVVGYSTYPADQETNCSMNKTMIYAGTNDGMIHAFRDCDGEEEWAFIPTNYLGTIRRLMGETIHVNYADSTIEKYVFDRNNNGAIDDGANEVTGDKVFLIFGQRRGGGIYAGAGWGYYYVLDVSVPTVPKFIAYIHNGNAPYAEMGETWSEPKLGKMKILGDDRVVMFVGAGYDNCNEDSRFGATMTFTGTCPPNGVDVRDEENDGLTTSSGAVPPYKPKGRGIFAIPIATLDSNGNYSGKAGIFYQQIWRWTAAEDPNMKYSIPSEMFLMDVNFDGYVDRLYAGDTGGYLWRFDVGDPSPAKWQGTRVFAANPGINGVEDTGRKVFYKGDATIELDSVMVFFATGDREHPLNRAVVDRVYTFVDKKGADYSAGPRTEKDLVDVTEDQSQETADMFVVDNILLDLQTKDGWFVRLDGMDYLDPNGNPVPVTYPGEKSLATVSLAPIVGEDGRIHPTLWATTYRPLVPSNADKCTPGNLGYADVIHFDYKTGEAVKNFDPFNDNQYNTRKVNKRSAPAEGKVLLRTDRRLHLGRGIPSGIVQCITAGGKLCLGVGSGGGYQNLMTPTSSGVRNIYWRQR